LRVVVGWLGPQQSGRGTEAVFSFTPKTENGFFIAKKLAR
jgi:hypothetical protein